MIYRLFRTPALSFYRLVQILGGLAPMIDMTKTEWCFYVETTRELNQHEAGILKWLLAETFDPRGFSKKSFVWESVEVIEVGPRLNFETPFSTTAVTICRDCGLDMVTRLERSVRIGFSRKLSASGRASIIEKLQDRMTEQEYIKPLGSFEHGLVPLPVRIIPVIEEGIDVLHKINKDLGLAMDEQDLSMVYDLFVHQLKRNPTDVELFQLGQANSEHCRHGYFNGKLIVDGQEVPESLFKIVKASYMANPRNSVIAFHDDASAIRGLGQIEYLVPMSVGIPMPFEIRRGIKHPTCTAETHNFPSGVAPNPGAQTGTGGRIRDNMAVGRGGEMMAGGAMYCVGNLLIPGYDLPWEEGSWPHPAELASPIEILIQASNGASYYGNCIGEPVIYGSVRTFGMQDGDDYESYFKPIMYTVGLGQVHDCHKVKDTPEPGMLIIQIGGPAYRIGIGGGAASSMMQGDNKAELDFNAVQRGAPEMEQRVWRVTRACIAMEEYNPIAAYGDLGAGGSLNSITERVQPAGGRVDIRKLPIGDSSLSAREIWGNESQERMCALVWPKDLDLLVEICARENCPMAVVGVVTGDGMIVLHDEDDNTNPVELPLGPILENLPRKTFDLQRITKDLKSLTLPENLTVAEALERVLRLPAVASKGFLTRKVDRSVTGLIVQQQCVGPNHLPLADCAIVAQSHFTNNGIAASLGEQPTVGLISPAAMARVAIAEAIFNMVGSAITDIQDIRYSGNWMLAVKLPGEGARMLDAAYALRDISIALGIAEDGGKDSLSMAAKVKSILGETKMVKSPAQLVIAAYCTIEDVNRHVTPVMKRDNVLIHLDCNPGKKRLGGSALAQCYKQKGNDCPDIDDVDRFKRICQAVQSLVHSGLITACHDVSDGGLITTLLEMAFASNMGLRVDLDQANSFSEIEMLFSQEPGLVIACQGKDIWEIENVLESYNLELVQIGQSLDVDNIAVRYDSHIILDMPMTELRLTWEATSSAIDALQANPTCVEEEKAIAKLLIPPTYRLSFDSRIVKHNDILPPKVAIIRTEGSNGDLEMAASFKTAGFDAWDVTISDLIEGRAHLSQFRGVAFVGGFTFADVLDSAKGWAGQILFNEKLADQFREFYHRPDTFSFGVCNGCQLMALLRWIPFYGASWTDQPRFIHNKSNRFESRYSAVAIEPSPAIMLTNMEGSILPVWVAHGEGQLIFPNNEVVIKRVIADSLAPIRYVDEYGDWTEKYPFNPNGSPLGITALCSPDGRHLAMMPHPERTFQMRLWAWTPEEFKNLPASPWMKMFDNAYRWCTK